MSARHRFPIGRADVLRGGLFVKGEDVVAGAVSLAWALVLAVAAYALMRVTQVFMHPDPDPSAVSWSVHAGYYWRIWTVSYGAGIVVFVMLLVTRGRVERSARALVPAVGMAAVVLALQVAFFP
jgi:hypothetical protein